jgi:hypothetical protein
MKTKDALLGGIIRLISLKKIDDESLKIEEGWIPNNPRTPRKERRRVDL